MVNVAAVNASPLILLARGGHLELLHGFAEHCLVPVQVADEIMARGVDDPTARALTATPWISIIPLISIPILVSEWTLGPGESSVLAYAYDHPGTTVVIDDLAARKCAACLGIQCHGTLGIILLAKTRGLIPKARPVIEDLLRHGLYLSRPIIDQALILVGE